MPDWNSPHALESQAVALQRLSLVFIGIYFYEFAHWMGFDWMLLTKKESKRTVLARSVKWIYIACRYTTLAACICLAFMNLSYVSFNCQAFMVILNLTGFLTAATGTLLLFVRVGVIWEWRKWVTVTFSLVYLASIAFALRSVILIRAVYESSPIGSFCATTSAFGLNRRNILLTLIMDVGLVVSLFWGLTRWGEARHAGSSVWLILWNQNMTYLVLAIALEVPMTVFFFLNYNEFMDLMFTVPETMILPIAATRFYRSLTNFTGNRNNHAYESTVVQPRVPRVDIRARKDARTENLFIVNGGDMMMSEIVK
ncbi:unnamed protein product [Peniophora sp. CBMAI 1063]|nr:unnamed protein product [Peniophora sp. CBMAI 1063]